MELIISQKKDKIQYYFEMSKTEDKEFKDELLKVLSENSGRRFETRQKVLTLLKEKGIIFKY